MNFVIEKDTRPWEQEEKNNTTAAAARLVIFGGWQPYNYITYIHTMKTTHFMDK